MPGKVKVKIISGRNLPVMDRSSDTTDAYVEIKLGSTTYKTDVCRKSLHPQWNSDWYRFEVDDSELQDEPLQIRLMDHDTYSANDAIGKVYLDLNPLLLPAASLLLKWNESNSQDSTTSPNSVMSGWIPVYDTMHGIRGEVNIVVKVELFSDFNKFRQSSCGVQFFCSPVIPHGYFAQVVHGFVEELVVSDDPEYQWIDKIRTPRASNEARQTLFFKLSGELQRKIGVKALDLGGNAVIGYSQSFDLEGESGIVARGIGTAVTLVKMIDMPNQGIPENNIIEERAQSYLKFLGSAKGFFLNSDSDLYIKKTIPRPWPSPSTSIKSLKLLDDIIVKPEDRLMTRHLSDREFNVILRPPPHVLHHSKSLQTLLKQEDMRGRGYGISQRFRKFRNTSQNMLSKKMTALKAKLADSNTEIDNIDTEDAKKRHAYKYRRTQSDSTGMAEILVRSVFNATSSLGYIAESPHNLHQQCSTIEDENESELIDASYLSLPDTSTGTHSSNASLTSSDTSSLDDDPKTDMELETVSHIVETVRKLSMIQHPIHDFIKIDPELDDKLFLIVADDMCSRSDDGFNTSETLEPDSISNVDTLSLDRDSIIEPHSLLSNKILIPHAISSVLEEANLFGSYTAPVTPEEFDEKPFFLQSLDDIKIITSEDINLYKLGTKFTSLHNIHDASSSYNDYSAHQGKETVLGELFHRVALKQVVKEQTVLSRTKFTSLHNIHDATSQINKHSAHKGKETVLGSIFKRVQPTETKKPISEHHSFFSHFVRPAKTVKKLSSVRSLTEMDITAGPTLSTKFTSLHNIHDACSKINEYSAHKGKETVLGELFHKIRTKENVIETPIKVEKHGLLELIKDGKDKILHGPKELFYRLDSKLHENKSPEHLKNDSLLGAALGNVVMGTVNEILATSKDENNSNGFYIGEKEEENPFDFTIVRHESEQNLLHAHSRTPESTKSIKSSDGDSPKEKSIMGKILSGPKVLFHRLDSKLHESPPHMKNEHGLLGTALGNVLMESVNEIMATSKTDEKEKKSESIAPIASISEPCSPQHFENESSNFESYSAPTTPDSVKPKSKSIKSRILKGPKMLFQRLDSKRKHDDCIKHPHGLLNTALENVLRDSVNEVMATSGRHYRPVETNDLPSPPIGFKDEKKSDDGFIKTGTKKLVQGPKNLFHRLDSKLHKKHDDGLLKCALDNVLMDTVNDMLATSKPTTSSSPVNNNFANNVPELTNEPINTEIDKGNGDSVNSMHACLTPLRNVETPPKEIQRTDMGHYRTESVGTRISHSPAKLNSIPCIHRRSSDSDLSITPKGNSLTGSDRSGGGPSGHFMRSSVIRTTVPQDNFDLMEYPFLTLSKYPIGFITFIGGAVSVRSVKLLERITNIEEPESRDIWWSEIRMEIRSHARSLNCNAVLGYTETTSICDDVCVLSASGTAAIIGFQYAGEANDNVGGLPIIPKMSHKEMMTTSLDRTDFEKEKVIKAEPAPNVTPNVESPEKEPILKHSCSICHLPYSGSSVPIRGTTSKCSLCRSAKVPDVLIATIEIPDGIPSIGRGCFVQSYVCRPLRDLRGESNAKEISDGLPFLEYELHRLLINKLQVKGMNAVFGLKVRISIGERMMIGIATGTAVYLTPLPTPPLPKLVSDRSTDEKKLTQLQKSLHDTVKKNKEIYQLKLPEDTNGKIQSDTDDSEDEQRSLDLSIGNKDCCILEVDDPEDVDVLNALMEPRPPDGFHVVNTEIVPGLEELEIVKNLQMFTQIWRAKMQAPYSLDKHFHRLLQSVYFKLRRMIPCALCDLQFRVDSPEPDEIQLCVLGMALGLGDPLKNAKLKRKNILTKRNEDELIFNLEEDNIPEHSIVENPPNINYLHTQSLKYRQKSPTRNRSMARQRHVPHRERHGVDITPLSYVPGGKIEKYLGNLNFFFIRETTSIREEGGLSGFIHSFVTEILAIVRAHVTALGGNAMVAYFVTECVLNHNLHKNQGQCLINVGGDVVYVTYYSEDH